MINPVEPLILDLLEWIGLGSCPYAEVLEVWRTSCPQLPIWEEANSRGFIDHMHKVGHPAEVKVSPLGFAHLQDHRPASCVVPSGGGFASSEASHLKH